MWSYSGDPSESDLDQVRFYCQDTVQARPLLQDEEIDFLLATWADAYNSPLAIAAVACEVIAGKFAASINVSADGVNIDQGSLQSHYMQLAAQLREQYKYLYQYSPPDLSSIMSQDWDPEIVPLTFSVGLMDNYRAGNQDYGSQRGPGHSPGADWPYPSW